MTTTRSGKLTAGGIIAIIAGVLGLINSLIMAFSVSVFINLVKELSMSELDSSTLDILNTILVTFGVIGIVLSILAIVGGAFALNKKNYPFALICGGIFSIFTGGIVLGILAIIFISMSRNEFITVKQGTPNSSEVKS